MEQPRHPRPPMISTLQISGNNSSGQVPKSPEDHFIEGWNALKDKSFLLGLRCLDQAIGRNACDPRYYYARSFALEALKRFREALADIDQAVELNAKKPYLVIESSIVNLYARRLQIFFNQPETHWSGAELVSMVRQLVDAEPSLDSLLSPSTSTAWSSMMTPPTTPRFPPDGAAFGDSFFSSTPSRTPLSKKRTFSDVSYRSRSSTIDTDSSIPALHGGSSPFSNTSPESYGTRSIFDSPLAIFGERIERSETPFISYDENKAPNPQMLIPGRSFPTKIDFTDDDVRRITNPLGLKALFVRNVNRTVRPEDLLPVFQRFGRVTKFRHFNEKSRSAFVCYESAEAALSAMRGLFNFRDQRLCYDPTISWMFRFAPGDDQTDQQYKNATVARQVVEAAGECYDWRIGMTCQQNPCPFAHIAANQNRDSKVSPLDTHAKRYR